MKVALGVVLLATKKAMGTAIIKPNRVPNVAMLIVSYKGHHISCTDDYAGGIMREPMSLNCAGTSDTKAQMVSCVMTWKVQVTKAKIKTHSMNTTNSDLAERLRHAAFQSAAH
jgi:hypothetical protein